MKISGLHFLITYKCNSECAHCFLSCGPKRNGNIEWDFAEKIIDDVGNTPSINYFYLEGGEPFLLPKLIERIIRYANEKGYWVGALSNGFWAKTIDKGIEVLKPLKEAGLQEIGVSTDEFHQKKIPLKYAKNAVKAAKKIGIEAYLMETSISEVRGRGRGAKICIGKPMPWQKLTVCPESLADPSRVHIGPEGHIHLCQGLLIGEDARNRPLENILENHMKKPNIIVEQLIKGGPAQLAKFAQKYGFKPEDTYVQGCQLCFETRAFLRKHFPKIIAPPENYV